jgi:hypothetical protein
MTITNFKPHGISGRFEFATVDVTTGFLWWKRTETADIFRNRYGFVWKWAKDGTFTPDSQVEQLEQAYLAMLEYQNLCST